MFIGFRKIGEQGIVEMEKLPSVSTLKFTSVVDILQWACFLNLFYYSSFSAVNVVVVDSNVANARLKFIVSLFPMRFIASYVDYCHILYE